MGNQESSKAAYFQFLFLSVEGRIPRSTYWGASIASFVAFIVIFCVVAAITGKNPTGAGSAVLVLFFLPYLIGNLCLSIKRLHDCDLSGFFLIFGFIPYIGALFMFIVPGCWPGTSGTNEYGKDPLASEDVSDIENPIPTQAADGADSMNGRGPI
jgi:uncharacterized membrane protein YhaH (DUF805 family)